MGNGDPIAIGWAKYEKSAFIDHYSPLTVQKSIRHIKLNIIPDILDYAPTEENLALYNLS